MPTLGMDNLRTVNFEPVTKLNYLIICRMNFLAHFFLCSENTALVAGNFLGDFVKGKKYMQYPGPVATGILMHREIDAYTDAHPEFLASKHRLVPEYGHYAGVVVDMFYDHLLALHWHTYSPLSIERFIDKVYRQLQTQQRLYPAAALQVYQYMTKYNWLHGYTKLEGIQRALEGIASRSPYAPDMRSASEHFRKYYTSLQKEFHAFFPQIIRHVASFLPGK